MSVAEAVPNLLICLREGLEAGLVVTILLAAVRRLSTPERPVSTTPVWLGVLGAVSVAGSFAAVLTYSTAVLTSSARAAVAGVLSVLAVALVTAMIFWMRRTGASLSGQLRGEVARAAGVGAGVLAVTAFLAVGREGLETTLFVWTAIKAAGSTVAPLVGAALGLVLALALCWLLFRRAVRLNLGVFFNRTAVLLIVIAAGVLAYGLGDLQEAGWLPGARWIAFDLSAHVDPNSWWVSIITGVTNLSPKMTVLQVVAWIAYLATVIPLFLRAGQPNPATAPQPAATPDAQPTPAPEPETESVHPDWWERLAGPRPVLVGAVLVLVPVLAAAAASALLPAADTSGTGKVTVTADACAPEWTSARTGTRTISVHNASGKPGEIDLVDADGAVAGEIENIGPGTTAELTATLNPGSYTIVCLMSGRPALSSARVRATGPQTAAPLTFKQVRTSELRGPNDAYQDHVRQALTRLTAAVATVGRDLKANNIPAAQADWLLAQQEWERVGASYNSFGDAGTAVDGLPGGLPGGVEDPDFTGLHRLEYGLWHGQGPDRLLPVVDKLGVDIAAIGDKLTSTELAGDPATLPVRAHEILEDALRDHFSGLDDQGGGAAYPMTLADVEVTRVILDRLGPLLDQRDPKLRPDLAAKLDKLRAALLATQDNGRWRAPAQTPPTARQAVIAATGGALEALSRVPRLLETRAN
ncbi:iron uptake transporter permease EfeU [Nocardia seriolae]|uniref:iron uptake transporter permease EfeU n=1 Tax=Nocardia seriolae TaxID=37332 RepID=UPI0008FF5809|nr:iron uptake transporter permease EfeU [Nocardia seriolae]OJF78778.1 iron permease [Nocardia seriolae]PSK30791.1 iron permease [Nocardia seriolae]QOW30999.1 FTR1 family protein [Nocardia seriolae]QUN15067.1 FTR1 family protein [Nocardia seriolae]WNJ57947.1 iron uptake transporter permease EfeU [Nocardia seriolae]